MTIADILSAPTLGPHDPSCLKLQNVSSAGYGNNSENWPRNVNNNPGEQVAQIELQGENAQQLLQMCGGGVRAARALQMQALSRGQYELKHANTLPFVLLEIIFEYLQLVSLPKTRCVSRRFQRGLAGLLARNAQLAAAFDAHVNARDVVEKRVWVAVRVKPVEDAHESVALHHNRITVKGTDADGAASAPTSFFFDGAFNAAALQADVWGRVSRPVMTSLLKRKHVCFLAYGQTGSGKTHTMFGDRDISGAEGVAFRAVRSLSRMIHGVEVQGKGVTPLVEFSFLEVYNEKVYDLLANQKQLELVTERDVKSAGSKYKAAEYSGPGHVVAKGLTRRRCDLDRLEEQIGDWVYEGASTRTVGKTVFNEQSSRSHAIGTIHVTWEKGGEETRFYLVDLAGSERAGQYALSADQLKQGVNINKSLSTMARVITVLASGAAEHVPYRDSTLTWLLSDAITGINARVFMVATINPLHVPETMSTLQYAQRYSSLQSNQEELNKIGSSVRKSLAKLQHTRQTFKALIKDAGWTRATLAAQMALNNPRDSHQLRKFYSMLAEVEQLEAEHARRQRVLDEATTKSKEKEQQLIRED